jgi:hypothetical protein
MIKKLIVLIFVMIVTIIQSIDVSWIPSDIDGPLPLSSKFRNSLEKLCKILSSGESIPPEVKLKEKVIQSMCKKLQPTNTYLGLLSERLYASPYREIFVSCVIIGTSTVFWNYRNYVIKFINKHIFIKKDNKATVVSSRTASREGKLNADEIRKARIQQFSKLLSKDDKEEKD